MRAETHVDNGKASDGIIQCRTIGLVDSVVQTERTVKGRSEIVYSRKVEVEAGVRRVRIIDGSMDRDGCVYDITDAKVRLFCPIGVIGRVIDEKRNIIDACCDGFIKGHV